MKADADSVDWLTPEVVEFQMATRRFLAERFAPRLSEWRSRGRIDRSYWQEAGELGLLAASLPAEYGGGGSYAFMAAALLEQGRTGDGAWGIAVHNYVCHYVLAYGTDAQKSVWLADLASGRRIGAIAMTEPGAGSDLSAIATTARRSDGCYVINGQKTFISNGQIADLVCVAAKTDPAAGRNGLSLLLVEAGDTPGFVRGAQLKKIGLHAADVSELFFEDASVPVTNLLGGEEGHGFQQLSGQLPWERLSIAIKCVGLAEYALQQTLSFTCERRAFGKRIADFQNSQFKLAEAKIKLEAMRAFVYSCVGQLLKDRLGPATAAMVKSYSTQALGEIVDECLQLHGGYGYMEESPIARLYCDVRASRIFGGSNEIMKLIVARDLTPP